MHTSSLLLVATLISSPASAHDRCDRRTPPVGPVEVVVPHRVPGDFTEGIAFSRHGDMYVGYGLNGDILRVPREGAPSLLASLDPTDLSVTTGLAVDEDDNVYAGLWAFADPAINGVWKITPEGEASMFSVFPFGTLPNFIVWDKDGDLLVTDSMGAIWSVPRGGGDAELWLADELLEPAPGFFFGANGAARDGDDLFVLNTERGAIVRIPIRHDGTAGAPSLYLEDPAFFGGDGIILDERRNIYVVNIYDSTLLRINHCKEIETLVTFGADLPFATNLEFGVGRESQTAYLTIDGAADVVKVDIGIRGLPR